MHRYLGLGLHRIFLGDKIQPTTVPHESVEGIKWEKCEKSFDQHLAQSNTNYQLYNFKILLQANDGGYYCASLMEEEI